MAEQVYFEDVEEGTELPTLRKDPTTQQLVMYAGASGDYYQIHYDRQFALGNGLPDVILHGALKNAFLGQLMTDWIGEQGRLARLSVQYRGMDVPGTPIFAKGVVTRKGKTARWSATSGWRTRRGRERRRARLWWCCLPGVESGGDGLRRRDRGCCSRTLNRLPVLHYQRPPEGSERPFDGADV